MEGNQGVQAAAAADIEERPAVEVLQSQELQKVGFRLRQPLLAEVARDVLAVASPRGRLPYSYNPFSLDHESARCRYRPTHLAASHAERSRRRELA